LPSSESPLFVLHRTIDDFSDVIGVKRIQHQNLAARKQRRNHFKRRILGGSADQDQGSSLHVGQEVILLRFVEVVNLVNKKYGAFAESLKLLGFLNDFLEIFDPGGDG